MKRQALVLGLLSTTAFVAAGAAHAQQTSTAQPQAVAESPVPPPPAVSEVVVTALKQNSSVLKTPATVEVVTAATLTERNITTANQLNAVVPGLVMTNQTSGLPGVSFRGLGSNAAIINLEPSVGFYQDGVYLGHTRDYVSPLYDVDHVEFIAGTQSTLLGKNVSLGAISVVDRRPSGQFDWDANLSHSEGVGGNKADGGITIPISDVLSVRLAGLASEDDGYIKNLYLHRNEPNDREASGRLSVAFTPTNNIDGLFTYQHDSRRLDGQNLQVVSDPSGTVAGWSAAYGVPYQAGRPDLTAIGADAFDRQNTDRFNLILNDQIGPFKVTLQSAHIQWTSPRGTDAGFNPGDILIQDDTEKDVETTEELRVATDIIPRLKLLAGIFYYNDSWKDPREIVGSPNIIHYPLTGVLTSLAHIDTESASIFGSGTFSITDQIKLDAGLRFTNERKTGEFERSGTGVLRSIYPNIPLSSYIPQTTNPLDYNVGVRYEPTTWLMTYITYSEASKSGGYQDYPTTLAGAPFLPETADSFELGVKARIPYVSVSAAFFDTKVHNFQTSYTHAVGTPPVSQSTVGNAQVESTGFQADGTYDLSPNLRLGAEVVYADARFLDNFSTIALAGETLTRAPTWTGRTSAEYHAPIGHDMTAFGGASVDFASDTHYQFAYSQPLAPVGDAHQLVDARLGVRGPNNKWELAIVGTNLADKRYVAFDTSLSLGGGAYYGNYNRPRVVAIQLNLKY